MRGDTTLSRRHFLRSVLVLSAGAAVAACAPREQSAPEATTAPKAEATAAPAQPAAKGRVEVRWHAASGGYGDWSTARAEVFNAQQDGVTAKVEAFPEYQTKLLSMATTGLIGDGFWHWDVNGWMAEWAHLGVSKPCDDLIQAEGYDMSVYYPNAIEGIKYQGHTMGLPLHAHGAQSALFYNEDLLNEAGVPIPDPDPKWTLDDLIEYALKLKKEEGGQVTQWGWMSYRAYHKLNCWVRIFGSDFLTPDGTQSLLNSAECQEAYQWLVDAIYKHRIEPEPGEETQQWRPMFVAGKLAMCQVDPPQGSRVRLEVEDRFKWGAAVLPPGPRGDRGAQITTHLGSVTCASKEPAAVWEFTKFLSSHESGVDKVLVGAGAPGARPDCFEDPRVLEHNPEYQVVALTMAMGKPDVIPHNLRGGEFLKAIDNEPGDMWLGKQSVPEGAERLHKAMQDILAKPAAPGSECF